MIVLVICNNCFLCLKLCLTCYSKHFLRVYLYALLINLQISVKLLAPVRFVVIQCRGTIALLSINFCLFFVFQHLIEWFQCHCCLAWAWSLATIWVLMATVGLVICRIKCWKRSASVETRDHRTIKTRLLPPLPHPQQEDGQMGRQLNIHKQTPLFRRKNIPV